jgi:molybdopterin molybdotransferase
MADLLSIDEAQRLILDRVRPLPAETVPLEDARRRVLAESARATIDLPPFASSAMDGFAVRAQDTPAELAVVDRVAAGRPSSRRVGAGEAIAIATGGVVPEGADAVIPVEYVVEHDNKVVVHAPVDGGANIRRRGGDVHAGDVVVERGALLGPAQLGALAAAGVAEVRCTLRPRAAVVATGTELRRPGEPLAVGDVYEANSLILSAQLDAAGAIVARAGAVADDEVALRAALECGLVANVLVTSGGVSVGPHDLVRRIEKELGVEEVFWRVAVKPGKPIAFGVRGETLVFGVPGNPVSALVGFELFVRPAVLALQGIDDPRPRFLPGTLAHALKRNPRRDELVRARLVECDGTAALEPIVGQESHMIGRTAAADTLVFVPRGEGELGEGAAVRFLRLE